MGSVGIRAAGWGLALAALAAVSVVACTAILGDDFEVTETTSAGVGGTGAAGAGGSGAQGGQGAAGAQGGQGGQGAQGGQGGAGLTGPCPLGELGACGSTHKCAVIDLGTGETGCIPAGDHPPWSRCAADTDCVDGTWCELLTLVCKPICTDPGPCPGDGQCVEALVEMGTTIPGMSVCTADCHPISSEPCNQAFGTVACHVVGTPLGVATDCAAGGNGTDGDVCTRQEPDDFTTECAAGFVCVGSGTDWHCRQWCAPPGGQAQCTAPDTCISFGGSVQHQGIEYGFCN